MSLNKQTLNLFNFNYPLIKLDNSNVKVGTFFSGIGSPEMAFKRLKDNEIIKMIKSHDSQNALKEMEKLKQVFCLFVC